MSKGPYVVAVAGGTCSGKSTLAEGLAKAFSDNRRVVVMNMDSYFKKEPPTVIAPITRVEYVEHNHPDTLELDRMFADFRAALAGDAELLIIEGLFALHLDEIREAADLKTFVDLPSDERLVRRIPKHMARGQSFEQVTVRFLDTVRFRHAELVEPTRWHADVVLNGTLDRNRGLEVLKNFVGAELERREHAVEGS